jgi:hypothetical protein
LKTVGIATVLAITLEPNVGKISKSTVNVSKVSTWKEIIRESSWMGSITVRGIKSESFEEMVNRAAG